MIRAHDGCTECCLNWNTYEIGVNCESIQKTLQFNKYCKGSPVKALKQQKSFWG